MQSLFHGLAKVVSSRKGSRIIVCAWLALVVGLSFMAPGAKEHAISSSEDSVSLNTPSAQARALMEKQFPSDNGSVALLVFHSDSAISQEQRQTIVAISEWLSSEDKPQHISGAMPFHLFPEETQNRMFSEDGSTMLINAALHKDASSREISDALGEIRTYAASLDLGGMKLEMTGPAGIAADTTKLFADADLVLLFATVALILIILIIIYRSPLLALLPLVVAGIVYSVVDRLLGLAAGNGWIVVDKQAISIMTILLFAVLTDYCLFVVSRFREELGRLGSKHDAMKATMTGVGEPILFSGGTVLLAVVALFAAVFQPYHYFAPVFSIAMVVILLGGLTLIPAVFTLTGRAAYWPFPPKLAVASKKKRDGVWHSIGRFITKRPAIVSISIVFLMLLASANVWNIAFSFNLMKSFPEELSSRQGFELLEEHFPKGRLAPVTILLESDKKIELTESFLQSLSSLKDRIAKVDGVGEITPDLNAIHPGDDTPLPRDFLSKEGNVVKLELTLIEHPYEEEALATVKQLRDESASLLQDSGFLSSGDKLHFAGQTAQQLDVRSMNQRDMIIVFSIVIALITVMLIFQARSIVIALTMMATMLLSYTAAFGISWVMMNLGFGYDAISYRLPLYAFVFLIALGVDYNIMLVSRIQEESRKRPWKEAVLTGLSRTGSVISSAGVILAATFCVLMTQPLQELFLFGFIMAVGILLDTFIVRGMLLPALLILIGDGSKRSTTTTKTYLEG